jgi:hypothetical protein
MRHLERWLRVARGHPSGVLLAVQLLGVILYPFTEEASLGRAAFSLFGLVVLGVAVGAVRATPAMTWVAMLLGGPVLVLTIWEVADPGNQVVAGWSAGFHSAFYFYTAYSLIRYMFADNWVTRDELFATGACFTVVAWAFAYLYTVVQFLWPGSFTAPHGSTMSWMELLFLSFTTMTGTGLSDIVPSGSHARSFIMLEQLAGLNYVALVVARLLGLTLVKFRR